MMGNRGGAAADFVTFLRALADKQVGKMVADLQTAAAKIADEVEASVAQQTSWLNDREAKMDAELAKRSAALDARESAIAAAEKSVTEQQAALDVQKAAIKQHAERLSALVG